MKDRIWPASGLLFAFLLLIISPLTALADDGPKLDQQRLEVRMRLGARAVPPGEPLNDGPPGDDDTPNRDGQGPGVSRGTVQSDRGPVLGDARNWSWRELTAGLRLRFLRILRAW